MKKWIVVLFILSIVLLTSCNHNISETSTSANKTEQTESTSALQTTETTQNSAIQETTTTETTSAKAEIPEMPKGYQIPAELQDKIVKTGNLTFIELPSRILFSHYLNDGKWIGDYYDIEGGQYLSYYSKADGEVYINCFDPLCEHSDCSAVTGISDNTFFIDNRFYEIYPFGQIVSYYFDGTDKRVDLDLGFVYQKGKPMPWGSGTFAYDQYIFIEQMMENEEKHSMRYDTKTKTIEDLTEKNGNFIEVLFAYNGELYGWSADGRFIKTDLEVSYVEETEYVYEGALYNLIYDNYFIGVARGENTNEGYSSYTGILTYDMKSGKKTLISNEILGKEVSAVVYADENYYYFLADDPIYLGKSRSDNDMYNNYGGKIYRVNRDGTNCICIYDNIGMTFNSMIIYEDTVIVSASEIGVHGGVAQTWADGVYIGTIKDDGTIDKLEWVEVIA